MTWNGTAWFDAGDIKGPPGSQGPVGPAGAQANLLSIPSDILPDTDNYYNLGNNDLRWKSIHIGPGTLFITDTVLGTDAGLTVTNGVLLINGASQLQVGQLKFVENTIESTSGATDIQIGLTGSTASLVLNRNVKLASGKSLTFGDNAVQTSAYTQSFGSFESTQDQASGGVTSSNVVTFNTTTVTNGITVANSSEITYANAGTYAIDFNGLFFFSGGASAYDITVWYRKNGTDVANSAYTFTTTSAQSAQVMGHITDLVTLAAGDKIQICWRAAAGTVSLKTTAANTNPTRPASSSATFNTWKVG
jgi:hypothetical protein